MRNTLETRLGLFFALAIVATVLIFEMIGGLGFLTGGYKVRTRFDDVQQLRPGDPVKMAGVQVGRVDSISLTNNRVEVTLDLDRPEQVKTDSVATIRFVGMLGQNYVALDFGSPQAPQAEEYTLLQSTESTDLSSIMVKLESVADGVQNLTKTFSGDTINNLLGPFTDFLRENSPKLTVILDNMESISTQVTQGEGTVGRLIADETLYHSALGTLTNLTAATDEIKATVSEARSIVGQISAGKGTLGKLAQDESVYNETAVALGHLREILQKINQGQGSVGKLVNDETLFRNVKLTLQKVEKATEGLEDQGPLSVLGIAVNSLF